MEGILYLVDHEKKRRFIQIDVDKYGGEYLEDLIDGLIADSRREEESVPLEDLLNEMRKEGKLDD